MQHWITTRPTWLVSAALVAITAYVYWLTPGFPFVNIDDQVYLMSRPHLWEGLTVENVRWAFTTTYFMNWHPLTWISYLTDMELFGKEHPGGFHVTNVLFHTMNALLVFSLFRRMTGEFWKSAFVAAVFAVHPLRVESVAWVSERKDVLSTFFGLLAMTAYVRYAQHEGRKWFWGACGAFACSLMSKQTLVTLPFVLLLLDVWPLGRFKSAASSDTSAPAPPSVAPRKLKPANHPASPWQGGARLVLEKWPFFVLTVAGCWVAVIAQHQAHVIASLDNLTLGQRFQNVVVVYGLYLLKTIWPSGLVVFYPFPPDGIPASEVVISGTVLIAITALAVRFRRGHPYFLIGWLWYLGTFVPVIGIVQIGLQRMADRYTYVPTIGLAMAAAWLAPALLPAGVWRRQVVPSVAIAVLLALMITARQQTTHWANSIALFEHTVDVNPSSAIAHFRFGRVLIQEQQVDRAIDHYQQAVRLDPKFDMAHFSLGVALTNQGRMDDAVHHFEAALLVNPAYAHAHYNLGIVLYQQNRVDEAQRHFREAIRLAPYDIGIKNSIAMVEEEIRAKGLLPDRTGTPNPGNGAGR